MKKIKNFINKKIKLLNFKSSLILSFLFLVIIGGIFFANSKSEGQVFGWVQSNWSGLADTSATANAGDNPSNWTKFFSIDSNVVVTSLDARLDGAMKPFTDTSDTNFNTGTTKSNVYTNGSGTGAKVSLLKPDAATCTASAECANNSCIDNGGFFMCIAPCSSATGNGSLCIFNGLVYGVVAGASGQLWLDRNLGATRIATSSSDAQALGWLYQWGRGTDGHQLRTSTSTSTLSATSTPGHGNFIASSSGNYDWRSSYDDTLWQGVAGFNNPCPSGFRIATRSEWGTLFSGLGITNLTTAFGSNLKLVGAGTRGYSGSAPVGTNGNYWSSTITTGMASFYADFITIGATSVSGASSEAGEVRATGKSVRCIKN